jgi:hypothetical protein
MAFNLPPIGTSPGYQLHRKRSGHFHYPESPAKVDEMPSTVKKALIKQAQLKIREREQLMAKAGTNRHEYEDALARKQAWEDTLRAYGEVPDSFDAAPTRVDGQDRPPATSPAAPETQVKANRRSRNRKNKGKHAAEQANGSNRSPRSSSIARSASPSAVSDSPNPVQTSTARRGTAGQRGRNRNRQNGQQLVDSIGSNGSPRSSSIASSASTSASTQNGPTGRNVATTAPQKKVPNSSKNYHRSSCASQPAAVVDAGGSVKRSASTHTNPVKITASASSPLRSNNQLPNIDLTAISRPSNAVKSTPTLQTVKPKVGEGVLGSIGRKVFEYLHYIV